MTTIKIKYLGNKVDTVNNGFYNALGKEALRNEFIVKVQKEIKDLVNIDEIIKKIKLVECRNTIITTNTVFVISVNEKKYYLSNNFELISKEDFQKLDFTPYIKFDKSNCDINREEQKVNRILKYKSSDEAIHFIERYILNLPKSFKFISDKPNKIELYSEFEKYSNILKIR